MTRFVIVEKNKNIYRILIKLPLNSYLIIKEEVLHLLNMMSDCNLNLTKIQSLPVIKTPGKYAFFVDITFDSIKLSKSDQDY